MNLNTLFLNLAISLGLGLLVGLQRQRVDSQLAGIRTFALITLLGSISALLSQQVGGWLLPAGFVALAILAYSANRSKQATGATDSGLTTEITILLMYSVGAYLILGQRPIAVAVAGATLVLLHFKQPMHQFVEKIGEKDLWAIVQLAIISLIILPILPNRTFGPLSVLNPFQIWLMVVLIVCISLAGYLAYKLFGEKTGALLAGILGGAISSTATTVSFARRSRETPDAATVAAVVIMIAGVVSFLRVTVEVFIITPRSLHVMAPPLAVELLWMSALATGIWLFGRKDEVKLQEPENPAELKSALIFGTLYAVILFVVAATKRFLGDRGLYAAAIVSGMTDMDAITLSTSQLVNTDRLTAHLGWRIILLAAMSNTLFKGIIVWVVGHRRLGWRVSALFGAAIVGGALLLMFWPDEKVAHWLRGIVPTTQPATQPATNP